MNKNGKILLIIYVIISLVDTIGVRLKNFFNWDGYGLENFTSLITFICVTLIFALFWDLMVEKENKKSTWYMYRIVVVIMFFFGGIVWSLNLYHK